MADNHQGNKRDDRARHLEPYRWQPGQSGNPKGRPRGRRLTSILREVLDGKVLCGDVAPLGLTVGEAFVESMVRHAINGDSSLIREIMLRSDGKAPDEPEELEPPKTEEEIEQDRYLDSLSDDDLMDAMRQTIKEYDEAKARATASDQEAPTIREHRDGASR